MVITYKIGRCKCRHTGMKNTSRRWMTHRADICLKLIRRYSMYYNAIHLCGNCSWRDNNLSP